MGYLFTISHQECKNDPVWGFPGACTADPSGVIPGHPVIKEYPVMTPAELTGRISVTTRGRFLPGLSCWWVGGHTWDWCGYRLTTISSDEMSRVDFFRCLHCLARGQR